MKEKIKHYLATDRSYHNGLQLVHQFSRKMSLKKQLNAHPESEYTLGLIIEELRELSELSHDDLKRILRQPVASASVDSTTLSDQPVKEKTPVIKKPVPVKKADPKKKVPAKK